MSFIEAIFNVIRNKTLNAVGVERDLMRLIQDKDISICYAKSRYMCI